MHLCVLMVLAYSRSDSGFFWKYAYTVKLIVIMIASLTDIESEIRIAIPAREPPGARSVPMEAHVGRSGRPSA